MSKFYVLENFWDGKDVVGQNTIEVLEGSAKTLDEAIKEMCGKHNAYLKSRDGDITAILHIHGEPNTQSNLWRYLEIVRGPS